ncbi:MAG: hypothetical protein BJ554DRAFT_5151, partial [Olpidium bornovanus]
MMEQLDQAERELVQRRQLQPQGGLSPTRFSVVRSINRGPRTFAADQVESGVTSLAAEREVGRFVLWQLGRRRSSRLGGTRIYFKRRFDGLRAFCAAAIAEKSQQDHEAAKKKAPAAAAAGVAANKAGKRRAKPADEAAQQGATADADAATTKPFPNAVGAFCAAHQVFQQSPNGLTVWNEKGYRLTKATHGVEEGGWYYELTIGERPKGNENLRVGWAQISADLQGPCGMDCFAYGYRMTPGTVFHASRGREYGTGYGELLLEGLPVRLDDVEAPGDVLGCLIHIPPLTATQTKDLESRRWTVGQPSGKASKRRKKNSVPSIAAEAASSSEELTPEDAEAKTGGEAAVDGKQLDGLTEEGLGPPLDSVKGSQIVFFRNGKCEGVAFSDIFLGEVFTAGFPCGSAKPAPGGQDAL